MPICKPPKHAHSYEAGHWLRAKVSVSHKHRQCCRQTTMIFITRCTNYDFHKMFFVCGQKVDSEAVTLKNHKMNRIAWFICVVLLRWAMRGAMDNLSFWMHNSTRISRISFSLDFFFRSCCLLWTHNTIYSFKLIAFTQLQNCFIQTLLSSQTFIMWRNSVLDWRFSGEKFVCVLKRLSDRSYQKQLTKWSSFNDVWV